MAFAGRASSPLPAARAPAENGARGLTRPTLLALGLATALAAQAQTPVPPVVTGVTATEQYNGAVPSGLVNINYTISDANFTSDNVFILVSQDSGATWTVPALSFTGAYGTNISVTTTPTAKSMTWNAGADWGGNYTTNCRVRVLANNLASWCSFPRQLQPGRRLGWGSRRTGLSGLCQRVLHGQHAGHGRQVEFCGANLCYKPWIQFRCW